MINRCKQRFICAFSPRFVRSASSNHTGSSVSIVRMISTTMFLSQVSHSRPRCTSVIFHSYGEDEGSMVDAPRLGHRMSAAVIIRNMQVFYCVILQCVDSNRLYYTFAGPVISREFLIIQCIFEQLLPRFR